MELWIARDKDGELYLYDAYPEKRSEFFGNQFGFIWWVQFAIYLIGVCIVFGVLIVNIINSL